MGAVFRITRELAKGRDAASSFGTRRSEDPQAEAEAWRRHFEVIQQGAGDVNVTVWQDVTGPPAAWLDDLPASEDIRRAINDMDHGRAPGLDQFMAEYLKFGGRCLFDEVARVVQAAWQRASAADGAEASAWPDTWLKGVIVPLWKRKGNREDKNTWRGITLLSVGSKLVARICAARLLRWCQPWLNPMQFGFRRGTGVDDVQQITRAILEEAAGSLHDQVYLMRFFDLEKAYPKVPRHGLWRLLSVKGCPEGFLRVLRAIQNHTSSQERFQGTLASGFVPERGLREGCPSSPILFNVFHHGIMEVFRARRARAALGLNAVPGVSWTYKVDGRIGKRTGDRQEEGRNTRQRIFGDFAYAHSRGGRGSARGRAHFRGNAVGLRRQGQ